MFKTCNVHARISSSLKSIGSEHDEIKDKLDDFPGDKSDHYKEQTLYEELF